MNKTEWDGTIQPGEENGECKEDEARLFSEVLGHKRFHVDIRKH